MSKLLSLARIRNGLANRTTLHKRNHPLRFSIRDRISHRESLNYVGWCNYSNFGDDIIARIFRRDFWEYNVRNAYPRKTIEDFLIDTVLPRSRPKCCVLGGGTLIGGAYWQQIAYGIQQRIPFFTYGTGCTEFDNIPKSSLVDAWRDILNKAFAISLRGPRSARLIAHYYGIDSFAVVGDPALSASELYPPISSRQEKRLVALNLGAHEQLPQFKSIKSEVRTVLKFLRHNGYKAIAIPMHPMDEAPIEEVIRDAGIECVGMIRPYQTAASIAHIAACDFVLTQRLHTSILAHSYGIPAIALRYSPKIDDHFEAMDQEKFVVDVSKSISEQFEALYGFLLDNRETVAKTIGCRAKFLTDQRQLFLARVRAYLATDS